MGLDQDKIKKRLSQIELDIDKMNQMIDDNLQLGTGTNKTEAVPEEEEMDESTHIEEDVDGDVELEVREVINEVVKNPEQETGLQRVVSAAKSIGSAAEEMIDNSMDAAVAESSEADNKDEVLEAAETSLEKVVSAARSIGSAAEEMVDNSIDAAVNENGDKEPVNETTLQKVVSATKSVASAAEEMIDNSIHAPVEPSTNISNTKDEVSETADIPLKKVVSITKSVASATEEMVDDSSDAAVVPTLVNETVSQNKANSTVAVEDDAEWEEFNEDEEDDSNKIVLPKHTSHNHGNTTVPDEEIIQRITSKRLPSRSFRVISVGSVNSNERNVSRGSNSRNSSQPIMETGSISPENDEPTLAKLEQRYDHLTNKTTKLTKEISYLTGMVNQGNLSIDDTKRLKVALAKLQEYLDRKTKERYETGVLLSRQLRRQIDRGENGQFWIGNK